MKCFNLTQNSLPVDVAIFSAAVADYKVREISKKKIKRQEMLDLKLEKNLDILHIYLIIILYVQKLLLVLLQKQIT